MLCCAWGKCVCSLVCLSLLARRGRLSAVESAALRCPASPKGNRRSGPVAAFPDSFVCGSRAFALPTHTGVCSVHARGAAKTFRPRSRAHTWTHHRAGVRATVTSLCGDPPDRNASPVGCVGLAPDHPRKVWCGACPCVGPIETMSLFPASSCHDIFKRQHRLEKHFPGLHVPVHQTLIRGGEDLNSPAWAFSPSITSVECSGSCSSSNMTEAPARYKCEKTGSPPKQETQQAQGEGKGRAKRRKGQPKREKKQTPLKLNCHSHLALLSSPFQCLKRVKPRAPRRDELHVHDRVPDDVEERENLVGGDFPVARCRHLESTRQPRMRKKTKKRSPHTE